MFGQSSNTYLNNQNLKAAGVPYPYTKDEIVEFIKCKKDPIYFIETYVKIIDVTGTVITPVLYDYQKKAIQTYLDNKLVITMAPRQMAKTTTFAMLMVWYLIFNNNRLSAILANKEKVAREILERVKFGYEHLPKFLQQGVVEWNKGSITLENNSRLIIAATSASAIRGFTVTGILFTDEFAHVKDEMADGFFSSVYPTISQPGSHAKLIISSTPKGFNHFYKMWNDAEKGRIPLVAFRIYWHDMPGRDQVWLENERKMLGELKFSQEVLCEFLGSQQSLISSDAIRNMSADVPLRETHNMTVYSDPQHGHRYITVCDPARGTGNDSSAFLVIDITSYPFKIALRFKDPHIQPSQIPTVLSLTAAAYNNSDVLVEINDNGEQIAYSLWNDLEYENMIVFNLHSNKPQYGVRTTRSVKAKGCSNLKEIIENQKILINDPEIISELSTFIQKKNSFEADVGAHDDLVMCLVLFSWLITTEHFKMITDVDVRKDLMDQQKQQIEDDVLPNIIIYDGVNNIDDFHSY